jgi:hypothetical protein
MPKFRPKPRTSHATSRRENPLRSIPVAPRTRKWDGSKAKTRIKKLLMNRPVYEKQETLERAFALWPARGESVTDIENYKLPVMDVVRGRLVLVPRAVFTAKAYLHGARGIRIDATRAQKRDAEQRLKLLSKEIQ